MQKGDRNLRTRDIVSFGDTYATAKLGVNYNAKQIKSMTTADHHRDNRDLNKNRHIIYIT